MGGGDQCSISGSCGNQPQEAQNLGGSNIYLSLRLTSSKFDNICTSALFGGKMFFGVQGSRAHGALDPLEYLLCEASAPLCAVPV